MKNIHVLPTDKPTWLHKSLLSGTLRKSSSCIDDMKQSQGMNIYITSDEEIKEGDWWLNLKTNDVDKCTHKSEVLLYNSEKYEYIKKIILTTDQDLIKDGVQAIDDVFLEWFVKNPSCEAVQIDDKLLKKCYTHYRENVLKNKNLYKIIIPKEEPKQETLEEVLSLETLLSYYIDIPVGDFRISLHQIIINAYNNGAKWQAERSYSEEEVKKLLISCKDQFSGGDLEDYHSDSEVIEWFKKRNKN